MPVHWPWSRRRLKGFLSDACAALGCFVLAAFAAWCAWWLISQRAVGEFSVILGIAGAVLSAVMLPLGIFFSRSASLRFRCSVIFDAGSNTLYIKNWWLHPRGIGLPRVVRERLFLPEEIARTKHRLYNGRDTVWIWVNDGIVTVSGEETTLMHAAIQDYLEGQRGASAVDQPAPHRN